MTQKKVERKVQRNRPSLPAGKPGFMPANTPVFTYTYYIHLRKGDPREGRPFSFPRAFNSVVTSVTPKPPLPLPKIPQPGRAAAVLSCIMMPLSLAVALVATTGLILLPPSARAVEREIYFTDFEGATPGDDNLDGYDSWSGNPDNRGSHGIDSAAAEGLGQTAFIGFGSPGFTTSASVGRVITHDPVATGEPYVRLSAVVGLNDSVSTGGGGILARDNFFISFFNSSFTPLASLNYNNTEAGFGLWRDDEVTTHDTGEEFIRNEIQLLFIEIDLINNLWSVELDGFAIFTDQQFTAQTGITMDLGGTAIVWQRAGFSWGNNWLLFDDWSVSVDSERIVIPLEPFKISQVSRDAQSRAIIEWTAQPGFTYQLEYSDDLTTWKADLPNSTKAESTETDISYVDLASATLPMRYYRVVRSQ